MQSRYQKAHKILQCLFTKKGPLNTIIYPTWIGSTDRFWYTRDLFEGKEFRLVDSKSANNVVAFDHEKLAVSLAQIAKEEVDFNNLPFSTINLDLDLNIIRFVAFDRRWQFDKNKGQCEELAVLPAEAEVISPDGKYLVFSREYNLWLRDLKTGEEKTLTNDGEEDYIYGGNGTAWGVTHDHELQVLWSPDSKSIFTIQRDTRQVEALPIVQHVPDDGSIRPKVTFNKIGYPGEEHVETLRLLTINIASGESQPAKYSQIPLTRNGYGFFTANLGWWHRDSKLAYFVDVDRYYKYARLIEFDTCTGKTRVLFEESSDTHVNLMNNGDMWPSYVPLPDTDELLWYSERTGWAHLYLYDLNTGQLKNSVTEGDWLVRDVVTIDPQRREVFIQTGSRNSAVNAYYRDLVRVDIDTGEMVTLASSDHDYFAGAFTDMQGVVTNKPRRELERRGVSPSGNFAVVTRSRVDTLPQSLVIDRDGNEVMTLETVEIQGLPDNWQWPEPVKLLSADKKTDIFGTVFRPSDFSANKSYPVISDVCNMPDFPFASIGAFHNNIFEGMHFFMAAALSELGFIVVQIDGRGSAYREKSFKDAGYGNLQMSCMLQDQVAGIQQLAERFPFMDMKRVGIHEIAGGQGVLQAMLDYPNLFKVGVTNAPHDSRLMSSSMWGDMFEGKERISQPFPEHKVESLQGRLLLMNGMLDPVTPPGGVFRIVDALQTANKDFDLILLPNLAHDPSGFGYLCRRTWDYFVQHLLEEVPPKEFRLSGVVGMK